MGLDDLLGFDVTALIADRPVSVTYHPVGGEDRTFDAMLIRAEPEKLLDAQLAMHGTRVLIARSSDPTVGIESVDLSGDEISLPLRAGDTIPTRCRVVDIVSANAGFWRLTVIA